MKYEFLIEIYETERIKVVSVWSEFRDEDLHVRPRNGDPRGRSVHEQMVHQCVSEDLVPHHARHRCERTSPARIRGPSRVYQKVC
jgi:hypothetical protein